MRLQIGEARNATMGSPKKASKPGGKKKKKGASGAKPKKGEKPTEAPIPTNEPEPGPSDDDGEALAFTGRLPRPRHASMTGFLPAPPPGEAT